MDTIKKAKPISCPNLPDGKVRSVLAGECSHELARQLFLMNIEVITPDESGCVLAPLRKHPDMLCHIGLNSEVFLECNQSSLADKLSKKGFVIRSAMINLKPEYPQDIPLNCAYTGKHLICRLSAADKALLQSYEANGIELVNVRQGYAKCSVCVVAHNAVITEDESIYKACAGAGIDALKIKKGFVALDGFDCGFIGGASGLLSKDCLAFAGDINKHPSYADISAFCALYGVHTLSLTNGSLTDIGGIIPLTIDAM